MDIKFKNQILQQTQIPFNEGSSKVMPVKEAIAKHVQPGMTLHFSYALTSCYALMYELTRQFAGKNPEFTLIALGLIGPQAFLVHGGLAKRMISTYYGNAYPAPGPNKIFQKAYKEGNIEIENWSLLSLTSRLKAGALGCGFLPVKSLMGSSMEEENKDAYRIVDDPFEPGKKIGAVKALNPDISFCHALVADAHGNAIITSPLVENIYGAMASNKGVVMTVEKIVPTEYIREHASLVRIPGHIVRSVSEVPFGAHPAAVNTGGLPGVEGYGVDVDFQIKAREASDKGVSEYENWMKEWIFESEDHAAYVKKLGFEKILQLKGRSHKDAWFYEFEKGVGDIDDTPVATPSENMIIAATHKLMERVRAENYTTVLAGIGGASLASWLSGYYLRNEGVEVNLLAEIGFYGYLPRPMDPFLFNHPNLHTCKMTSDNMTVLGIFMAGKHGKCIGSLAAGQIDRYGNINTTKIPPDFFITGSGGGNDVATCASECLVTAQLFKGRFVKQVPYITSPGHRIRTLVSDRGIFEKPEGENEFVLTGYIPQKNLDSKEACIQEIRDMCDWDLLVADDVVEIPAPTQEELCLLRSFDPEGHFLK
ncbi:MAG: glutaconate CoA-transferase [Desulfobacterales bacterium]|nr:glutaconate CoA-transferase [Desulfobacterales bacterium]